MEDNFSKNLIKARMYSTVLKMCWHLQGFVQREGSKQINDPGSASCPACLEPVEGEPFANNVSCSGHAVPPVPFKSCLAVKYSYLRF